MGDRVAVLRFGKLQQFASPNELYDSPANAFVAGFIGSPAMNLVTLPVAADGVKIGDSTLELERDQLTKLNDAGLSEVTFGIRPEQLELTDSGGVEVVVDLVEDLGSEAYVYTHAGSARHVELVARCNPRTAPKLADTVRLRRHPEGAVHLFHPADRRAHQLTAADARSNLACVHRSSGSGHPLRACSHCRGTDRCRSGTCPTFHCATSPWGPAATW